MNNAMHKRDLVREVAGAEHLPASVVERVLNRTIETIESELAHDRRIVLTGFGTFEVRHRSERPGVHPRTGEGITVSATRTPGFTAGSRLRKLVRESNGRTDQG